MKILILGGTGAMGISLVQILRQNKHNEIFVTSRKKYDDIENVHYLQGNAQDDNWLMSILKINHWDIIVDFMTYSTKEFKDRYSHMLNSTGQYIFFSSSRVYADAHGEKITEKTIRLLESTTDHVYLKTDEYALAKAREENLLLSAKNKNWTIIRPYITYNTTRLQLGTMEKEAWLYRALHGRTVVFSEDIANTLTTMTYGYDVAQGIVSIMGENNALGRIFHIMQSDSMTWREVAVIYQKVFKEVTNKNLKIKYLSDTKEFSEVFSNYWQVYFDRLYPRVFDNSKILQFMGESYTWISMEEGITSCLSKFILEKHAFRDINWIAEGWMDKKTGERTPFIEIPTIKQRVAYILVRYLPYNIAILIINFCRKFKKTVEVLFS